LAPAASARRPPTIDLFEEGMAPSPAGVASAMDVTLDPAPAPLPDDAAALAAVQPLLAARATLLRAHRKATCWLFFREVGVRPASAAGSLETLLACRICRPDVVNNAGWEEVRGSRGGLVRYSSTSGTSAMRTHVKNVHRKEAMALDRAVAIATPISGGADAGAGPDGASAVPGGGGAGGVASSVAGKRGAPAGGTPPPGQGAQKRPRDEAHADVRRSIAELEGVVRSLHGALETLRRNVDSL
jgi:hypothetical protein